MLPTVMRYCYVPVMLLGVDGAAIALMERGFSKAWLLPLLLLAVGLSFAAERLVPYREEWNQDLEGDSVPDVVHAAVNEGLATVSVAAVPVLAALVPWQGAWPERLPFVGQVLFAVLVADLGITAVHLASHKVGVLWRFHAVHHSVRRFYGFNGLMKHPLHQAVETSVGVAPLLALGLPVQVATALAFCIAVQLLLQHSNVDYRVGPLRYVLALNEGHRFHHLKWAGVGDVNFGLFTLLWDHLFRTFSYDADRVFSSDDLGMAAHPDFPRPYWAQLAHPFRTGGGCVPEDVGDVPRELTAR